MKINKKQNDNELVISLEGRLDTNTAPDLEKELSSLDNVKKLIFDLKKLEYISSAGLRIILSCKKIMTDKGEMIIKNVNDSIKEVFEITGFTDILTIEED